MRIVLDMADLRKSRQELHEHFRSFAKRYAFDWSVHDSEHLTRLAIFVSKTNHCAYDLILRWKEGEMACEIPLMIGNHPELEYVAEQFRIPFYCLPVTPETKAQQEQQALALLRKHHIDLVVLARYMQILSGDFIAAYPGRIINIHHAFLPAFQGANPYQRAYERGVKMIGATAHYATTELDEGPIIEQDVERVNHEQDPERLRAIGRDIERIVLARAVKAHLENRIIVSGNRTVVFS